MTCWAVILGCGFTGRRVALRLLERGCRVVATTRDPSRLNDLAQAGVEVHALDPALRDSLGAIAELTPAGARVLISVPTLRRAGDLYDPTPAIVETLGGRPGRVVYLSTTGVYGRTKLVDETNAPSPATERQRLRTVAEQAVAGGPWPSLILRPAAIYGPGRGVHARLARGEFPLLGEGMNYVSRIHVDDLAAIVEAALLSDLTGAYPVADDRACTSREIVEFCCGLLNLPLPASAEAEDLDETRRADRRVDGRAIRRLLGVDLRYPSYRQGVPACLGAEAHDNLPLP